MFAWYNVDQLKGNSRNKSKQFKSKIIGLAYPTLQVADWKAASILYPGSAISQKASNILFLLTAILRQSIACIYVTLNHHW